MVDHFNTILFSINQRTGIVLTKNQLNTVRETLEHFIAERQLSSEQILTFFERNPSAFYDLIENVLIKESYFFRNTDHFKMLEAVIFPSILDKMKLNNQNEIRILSVGCSAGQEPISILLSFFESSEKIKKSIKIDAIDLSKTAIKKAKTGTFSKMESRGLPADLQQKYFKSTSDGQLQLATDLLQNINFIHGSIVDYHLYENVYNIIFARNTLIYFDEVNSERVKQKLIHSLREGGYLFLGESEIGWGLGEAVQPIKYQQSIVYRKR